MLVGCHSPSLIHSETTTKPMAIDLIQTGTDTTWIDQANSFSYVLHVTKRHGMHLKGVILTEKSPVRRTRIISADSATLIPCSSERYGMISTGGNAMDNNLVAIDLHGGKVADGSAEGEFHFTLQK